jgi:hypothetical protein
VTDDKCATVTGPVKTLAKEDPAGPGERARPGRGVDVQLHEDHRPDPHAGEANPIVNTATVTAKDEQARR